MPIIIIGATILVFIVVYTLGSKMFDKNQKSTKRVEELIDTEETFDEIKRRQEQEERRTPLAEFCYSACRMCGIDMEGFTKSHKIKMHRAGVAGDTAIAYFAFMKYFGWIFAALFIFYVYTLNPFQSGMKFWMVMIVAAFLGIYILFGAHLWLSNRIIKRKQVLMHSFPDALDLLLVCVESGLALDAALARVCKELQHVHYEMTKELNKTRLELTLLNDRERALNNLSERTDVAPIKTLVAALIQSEKFGTSLIETLRVLSEDYRLQRLTLAEEKAGRIPATMTIPLILLMLPALLILILSPALIQALGLG